MGMEQDKLIVICQLIWRNYTHSFRTYLQLWNFWFKQST